MVIGFQAPCPSRRVSQGDRGEAGPAPDSSAAPVEPAAFGSDETMQMADEAAEEVDASAPRDDADGSPPTQGWL